MEEDQPEGEQAVNEIPIEELEVIGRAVPGD